MEIKNLLRAVWVILLLALPDIVSGQTTFSFTLPNSARTSAGVYKSDGTLVKTLWNGVSYNAGTYTQTWDGTDDVGVKVSNATYTVKILSNNVKYEWEGTIGNNSAAATGITKHRAFQGMYGMSISGNNAYYCTNYNEGWTSSLKFNTTTPFACTRILETFETSHCTSALAADSKFVYWGGVDSFDPENSFVFATNVSDDKEVINFSSGIAIKTHFGKKFVSSIDNVRSSTALISAMAVQKNGNYLFVARKKDNTIRVVNKTTGALVRTLTFTTPRGLAIDGDNNLWVIHGTNLVQKFAIQNDGTLSAARVTLNVIDPMAIAVSPDNSTVAVCDGGSSEQVKAFSVSTGASSWVLGQAGGYTSDPNVNDYKFFFVDRNKGVNNTFTTFIAFAPDGSFWVGDGGNYRAQHYSSSRTFIDRIMYLPHSYSVAVDRNDPTKVFNEYMEFKIDYSKPLAPNNGSWTLVRNYRATLPQNYYKDFIRDIFKSLITLSNGRTYAMLTKTTGDYKTTLVELPVNAPMRFTGIEFGAFENPLIEPKGDLKRYSNGGIGRSAVFSNCKFKGFDSSNNPIWDAPIVLSTIYPVQGTDPVDFGGAQMGQTTASGLLITFDKEGSQLGRGIGYHLGAIKPGENKFTWKTCKATSTTYTGDFPKDGRFDIGNGVRAPGCAGGVFVVDDNILWNYHGEFWKNSQTNFWNHFSDDGLMIGQFGTWKTNFTASAPAELAGNTFSSAVVKGPDGNLYVYHNDESIHAGVHRWKVTGLNTISEQNIAVTNGNSTSLCSGTGNILRENWANVQGYSVAEIPVNTTPTSTQLLTSFEFTSAIGNTHASRLRGYICPPTTGNYTFWIAGDNSAELWLSTSADPTKKAKIAYADRLTGFQEWEKSASQKSTSIYLQSGTKYYIEALQKGDNHNDHLSVGWTTPNGTLERPLPGKYLIPFGSTSARFANNEEGSEQNGEVEILTAYPNPFSSEITIVINLESQSFSKLEIFDMNGRLVSNLYEGVIHASNFGNMIKFSPTKMKAGVYILKLSTSTEVFTKRIVFSK